MNEHQFVNNRIIPDLKGFYQVEKIEQRHKRGFPDLILFDVHSSMIQIFAEAKVSDGGIEEIGHLEPVRIKSLKPHQINWMSSMASLGTQNRPNIGMILLVNPLAIWVHGHVTTLWRDKSTIPCLRDLLNMRGVYSLSLDGKVNPTKLREATL